MKKLKLLKLPDQHRHQCISLMYNMTKGIGPDIYDYQQHLYGENSNHNLRSASQHPNNVKLPPLSSIGNKRSFPCLAPSLWNDLPDNIKQIDSKKRFKKETKELLLQNYLEKCECTNPLCSDRKFHWFFLFLPSSSIASLVLLPLCLMLRPLSYVIFHMSLQWLLSPHMTYTLSSLLSLISQCYGHSPNLPWDRVVY